jgi:hypothetical protein
MSLPSPLFAYFGPETLLPMTSVVATVVGIVLMFGRNAFRLAARLVFRPAQTFAPPRPHSLRRAKDRLRQRAGQEQCADVG